MAEYALKGVSSRSLGGTRDAAIAVGFHHPDDDIDSSAATLQTRVYVIAGH